MEPTHMVSYVAVTERGSRAYGMFDATLPAGWTPENRAWCIAQIMAGSPQFIGVTVLGVTRYEVTK